MAILVGAPVDECPGGRRRQGRFGEPADEVVRRCVRLLQVGDARDRGAGERVAEARRDLAFDEPDVAAASVVRQPGALRDHTDGVRHRRKDGAPEPAHRDRRLDPRTELARHDARAVDVDEPGFVERRQPPVGAVVHVQDAHDPRARDTRLHLEQDAVRRFADRDRLRFLRLEGWIDDRLREQQIGLCDEDEDHDDRADERNGTHGAAQLVAQRHVVGAGDRPVGGQQEQCERERNDEDDAARDLLVPGRADSRDRSDRQRDEHRHRRATQDDGRPRRPEGDPAHEPADECGEAGRQADRGRSRFDSVNAFESRSPMSGRAPKPPTMTSVRSPTTRIPPTVATATRVGLVKRATKTASAQPRSAESTATKRGVNTPVNRPPATTAVPAHSSATAIARRTGDSGGAGASRSATATASVATTSASGGATVVVNRCRVVGQRCEVAS